MAKRRSYSSNASAVTDSDFSLLPGRKQSTNEESDKGLVYHRIEICQFGSENVSSRFDGVVAVGDLSPDCIFTRLHEGDAEQFDKLVLHVLLAPRL